MAAACDVLLTNAIVLTMDERFTTFRRGAIAITGFPEAYSTARMHGFDVLLEKPIDVVVLAAKIRELFGL